MNDNFKINIFFSQDGDEIEKLLANFLIKMLKEKTKISQNCIWKS